MVKSTLMTIQTGGQIKSQLNLKQVNDTRNKKPGRVDAASASLAPLALTMSLAAPKYQIQQSFSQLSQIQIQYKRHQSIAFASYCKYKFKGNNDFSHFLLLQVKVKIKDNRYKGRHQLKKTFSFGHCPNDGGGVYPCPNFLALFLEVHFWSIKRVYFFKNANVLNF